MSLALVLAIGVTQAEDTTIEGTACVVSGDSFGAGMITVSGNQTLYNQLLRDGETVIQTVTLELDTSSLASGACIGVPFNYTVSEINTAITGPIELAAFSTISGSGNIGTTVSVVINQDINATTPGTLAEPATWGRTFSTNLAF